MFLAKQAAELYAHTRPYHHNLVIHRISAQLDIRDSLDRALDIACGAGLSCIALKRIATKTVAADMSAPRCAQTNIIAAIERGEWTLNDARAYLTAEVSPYFPSPEPEAFDFGGPITYLRKTA